MKVSNICAIDNLQFRVLLSTPHLLQTLVEIILKLSKKSASSKCIIYRKMMLKGVDTRFLTKGFFANQIPLAPKYPFGGHFNFFKNSRKYSRLCLSRHKSAVSLIKHNKISLPTPQSEHYVSKKHYVNVNSNPTASQLNMKKLPIPKCVLFYRQCR